MKQCLVLLDACLGIALILMGFSVNITYLYSITVLVGLSCSGALVAKAAMYNICDEDNQTDIVLWTYGGPLTIAISFGPSVSGFLALPANQYPELFNSAGIFGRFPVLLICLVFGVAMLLLSVATQILMPEDKDMKSYLEQEKRCYDTKKASSGHYEQVDMTCEECETENTLDESQPTVSKMLLNDVLCNASAMGSVIMFVLWGGSIMAYVVLWQLWLETPRSSKGRGYSPNDVSLILLASGSILFILHYTLLAKFVRIVSQRASLELFVISVVPLISCIPLLGKISNTSAFTIVFDILQGVILTLFSGGFGIIQNFLKNCVPKRSVTLVLSISQLAEVVSCGIAPMIITSVFASSVENEAKFGDVISLHKGVTKSSYFPLDYHLAFYVTSLMFLSSYIPMLFIRKDIGRPFG